MANIRSTLPSRLRRLLTGHTAASPPLKLDSELRVGKGGFRSYSILSNDLLRINGVKDVVAVASGKGGVGKSTTAANKCQLKVGLLDADVYGPSVPTMMNIHRKEVSRDMKIIPIDNYGVKCMSMGFLVEKDAPIVWRGPMVMSALQNMSGEVYWGGLDILVLSMPPGTGDAQLIMFQKIQLSVSTPQDVALIDSRRGVRMLSKVQVPILGLIENMSCFKCPHCGEPSYIFGTGGASKIAAEMGLQLVGEIPIEVDIRKGCDNGIPIVVSAPDSAVSKAYHDIAQNVVMRRVGKGMKTYCKCKRLTNGVKSAKPSPYPWFLGDAL